MQEEFGCQAIFANTTSKTPTKDAVFRKIGSEHIPLGPVGPRVPALFRLELWLKFPIDGGLYAYF